DLIMIGHNGSWSPGQPSGDLDGVLLDTRTGRLRRIPFQGGIASPGCFLKDRKSVVISGADMANPALRPYVINLSTGENRPLGGELLASGFTLGATLSPDGKTIAVVHKGQNEGLLECQVCLIDIASGKATPLGKPLDTAFLSWRPDGKGLILVTRERPADPK